MRRNSCYEASKKYISTLVKEILLAGERESIQVAWARERVTVRFSRSPFNHTHLKSQKVVCGLGQLHVVAEFCNESPPDQVASREI